MKQRESSHSKRTIMIFILPAMGILFFLGRPLLISDAISAPASPAEFRQEAELTSLANPARKSVFAMDTLITLELYGDRGEETVEAGERMIGELESLWSVTGEESEIYRANHSQGTPVPISQETHDLVSHALEMAKETDGAFNPAMYPIVKAWGFPTREYRVPGEAELAKLRANTHYREIQLKDGELLLPEGMEIDLGAVAKGFAGDLLVDMAKENGVSSGIINLGGNVALIGNREDKKPWRVGIRSPYGEGNLGVLEAADCHIVTSGGYERYFTGEDGTVYWHILNPDTGSPARSGIISATIVGKEGFRCDSLSTAVFVMGMEEAVQYWRSKGDFDMILVTEENEVYVTENLREKFHLNEASQGIPVHIINASGTDMQ